MTTIQQLKKTTRLCRDRFVQTEAGMKIKTCRKGTLLTSEQRRQIMESIHQSFADVESCLRASYPALGNEDIDLCLLSAVQCPGYVIADCLSISEEAVRVRRHRLKGKLPQGIWDVFWEERKGARLLTTLFMKDTMQNVWRRFPWAVVCLTLLTVFCLWLCWTNIPLNNAERFLSPFGQRAAVVYGLAMGIVLAATLVLWGEEIRTRRTHIIVTVVANLLLLTDAVWLFTHPDAFDRLEVVVARASVITALAVAFFYLPFFRKKDDLPVWNFTWRTFLWFCISFLTGGVLTMGLLALLGSFRFLFGIDVATPWLMTVVIVCLMTIPVLLFLARIPEGEEKHVGTAVISKYLIFVIRYLFVPLMALYLITLYIYGARILIRWELPNGGVGWLVSALMAGCVVVELGLYPLMCSGEAKPFERWIVRWLPMLILPLLLLMTIGIGRRISDYGLTPPRVYLLLFNLWCYAVCIGLFVGKAKRIRWPMTSFAAVFLLTSVLPVNVTNSCVLHRRNKLDRLMENTLPANLPMDGEALQAWYGSLDFDLRRQVKDEMDFLLKTDPHCVDDLVTGADTWRSMLDDVPLANLFTFEQYSSQPLTMPQGYTRLYGRSYVSFYENRQPEAVTPDGIWFNNDVIGEAESTLFLDFRQLRALAAIDSTLYAYSADSTYVFVLESIDMSLKADSTVVGNTFGYILGK